MLNYLPPIALYLPVARTGIDLYPYTRITSGCATDEVYTARNHNSVHYKATDRVQSVTEMRTDAPSRVQIINSAGDCLVKTNSIVPVGRKDEAYTSVQTLNPKTGLYSIVRKDPRGITIGGYTMDLLPKNRNFAQGLKGKIEKAAFSIGSDSNGIERPVLRRFAALLFNLTKLV